MTQRSRTEIDSAHLSHIGVIPKRTSETRVRLELGRVEIAQIGENGVEPNGCMTFAQDKAITFRPFWTSRIKLELVIVKSCQYFCSLKRPTVVSGTGNSSET